MSVQSSPAVCASMQCPLLSCEAPELLSWSSASAFLPQLYMYIVGESKNVISSVLARLKEGLVWGEMEKEALH